MFSTNHKTIFVLDHSPYFGLSSDFPIDFDVSKSRGPGYVPLPPICKSLWTCSVEAAVEYCRIVWDLFPDGKLVQFVVSDATAHILNTWAISQQNLTHITNGLCLVAPVRRGAGGDVVGLCAAIEALGQPSPQQTDNPDAERQVQNRGRIICITSARDDDSIRSLTEIALNTLMAQNKKAALAQSQPSQAEGEGAPKTEECLLIHYCHLVIINVTPEKAETLVSNQPKTEMGNSMVGDILGVEVIVSRASQLAALLGRLVLPHYGLAVTTVTGIPMKEEQNASSSANYDVEIIHSLEAHAGLRAAQTATEALESVVLRWWTPRGAEGGTGSCNGPLWRVTPSDVASRPSACLVNFLLNGRSVTLEVPRKGGGRSASHILAAQGGELWIGALGGRTPYDDPPSLSEGAGGRVTDYRIKEFGALMHQNKLLPSRGPGANLRARARLQRHTTYWPLTISSTLIFNLGPVMEPLTKLVVQETLTDEEVETCRSVLMSLLGMESRNEFPTSSNNVRVKSSGRREEQWRQVWGELEALIRAHSASTAHRTLLRVLLECRAQNHTDGSHVDETVPYQDQCSSVVDKSVQCSFVEDKSVQCDMPVYDMPSDENNEPQTSIVHLSPPEPSTSTSPAMETNVTPNDDQTDTLATEYLDEILTHIGDTPKEHPVGKDIHANNAAKLNNVIQNGLRQEQKDKMLIDYPIPGNCQLFKAPILNPELKAATPEILHMNDAALAARQGQVGVAITALANAMDILATDKSGSNQVVLKHVSNACRLLCDSHFIDTKLRQSSLISKLDNTLKGMLKESKRDKFLFGDPPPDNSRATKPIKKSRNSTKTFVFNPNPIFRIKPRNPRNLRQPHRTAGPPSAPRNAMVPQQQPASSAESRATVIRATTDSPLSPVGAGSGSSCVDVWAPRNILDALLSNFKPSHRPDFAGRMLAGTRVATLYPELNKDVDV